jgi:hypothetical protein
LERGEMHTKFLLENLKGKYHLELVVGIKLNIIYLSLAIERAGDENQGPEITKLVPILFYFQSVI